MEAEKSPVSFRFGAFMVKNSEKEGECSALLWSFNFLSKIMQAANCMWFYQNPFCHELHKGCLPQNKND